MASQKSLQLLAGKLGLGDHQKVISKSAEFERLLLSRNLAGSNITDTAKIVICLDLAASYYGVDLDTKTAIKYSGLKSPSYSNCRKTIGNLLEINTEKLTVASLCVTLQCTGIQELAQKILKEYEKSKLEIDLTQPQYVCMAVYQACRLNKAKVSKSKLLEQSRLKPSQWTKIDAEWSRFVEGKFADMIKRGRPKKVVEEQPIEDITETENEPPKDLEPKTETYDNWKRRMLENAYKELRDLEMDKQDGALRRSPRKTPQKFSPYKESPNKVKGVRLRFSIS